VGITSFQWFLVISGSQLPQNLSGLNALGRPDASVSSIVAAIQGLTPVELNELRRVISEAGREFFGTFRGRELSSFLEQLHEAQVTDLSCSGASLNIAR
jgi:hypothetical protein